MYKYMVVFSGVRCVPAKLVPSLTNGRKDFYRVSGEQLSQRVGAPENLPLLPLAEYLSLGKGPGGQNRTSLGQMVGMLQGAKAKPLMSAWSTLHERKKQIFHK